jgi:heme-degrading monooxygenase HmoA
MRTLGDGTTEVKTLSRWESMAAVTAFAGDHPEVARHYPEDDRFLIEKPEHHRVVAGVSTG